MEFSELIPLRKGIYQLKEGIDAPRPNSIGRYVLKYAAIATERTFIEFSNDDEAE